MGASTRKKQMADCKFAIQVEKNITLVLRQAKSTAQYNETTEWIHTKRGIESLWANVQQKYMGISTHRSTHATSADSRKPCAAYTAITRR